MMKRPCFWLATRLGLFYVVRSRGERYALGAGEQSFLVFRPSSPTAHSHPLVSGFGSQ